MAIDSNETLIPKHGGYRKLKSFIVAEIVYDVTVRFCNRFIDKRSRTHDQMVQAARSGVQNIVEGSQASGTSKKMELKLTSVARASLEELKRDYLDFLRHRELTAWDMQDPRRQEFVDLRVKTADETALWVKRCYEQQSKSGRSGLGGQSGQQEMNRTASIPEIAANASLALIAVACSLLDRQIASLAASFENEGGFTERMYRIRSERRQK